MTTKGRKKLQVQRKHILLRMYILYIS